jgi:hypothetical protein
MSYGEVYTAESTMDRRLQERHRQADARHLAHQALGETKRKERFYSGGLVWLGARLVSFGSRLQERYRSTPASAARPANRLAS